MNTPLSWIKAYVPELDCSVKEYCDAMTLSGTKVESAALLDKNLSKIVVGKVLSIDKHPNADKLVVTKVQIDKEGNAIQIVTGAPNIKVGDLVPTVLDGGRVAGLHAAGEGAAPAEGFEIKAGELRGVPSYGMMCSIEELGSSRDVYPDAPADGVYIFSDNPSYEGIQPGDDAIEILGLRDERNPELEEKVLEIRDEREIELPVSKFTVTMRLLRLGDEEEVARLSTKYEENEELPETAQIDEI